MKATFHERKLLKLNSIAAGKSAPRGISACRNAHVGTAAPGCPVERSSTRVDTGIHLGGQASGLRPDGQPGAAVPTWFSSESNGDPGGSRTPNPQIRSLMLYPVELRGRLERTVAGGIVPQLSATAYVREILGWETGIEPATVGATVRCSAS